MSTIKPVQDPADPNLTVLINELVCRVGPYEASRILAAIIAEQWEAADEYDRVT